MTATSLHGSSKASTNPFDALVDIVGIPATTDKKGPQGPAKRSACVDTSMAERVNNIKMHMNVNASNHVACNHHMLYASGHFGSVQPQPPNFGVSQPYFVQPYPMYNSVANNYVTMTTTMTTTTTMTVNQQSQLLSYHPPQQNVVPLSAASSTPMKVQHHNHHHQTPTNNPFDCPPMQPVSSGIPDRESFRVQRGTKPDRVGDNDRAFGPLVEQLKAQCVKKRS